MVLKFISSPSPRPVKKIIRHGAVRRLAVATPLISGLLLTPPCGANSPVPANVRSAIARGLHWLARRQMPNGGFPCQAHDRPAVTSLAVLAFLARGYTPVHGPHHRLIDRAIDWVLTQQRPDGYFAGPGGTMYDQGISTVMLSEVYGMLGRVRRQRVGHALAKAVQLILAAQKETQGIFAGGWRYQPWSTDADISCSGWQLMALRGAADCGADVPLPAIKDGIAFLLRVACPNGGFAYQPGGPPGRARTGTGITTLELMGKRNLPQAINGGDYLMAHPLQRNEIFYYTAVYYCSQAANQLGGKYWRQIYPPIRRQLVRLQHGRGYWQPHDAIEMQGGRVYATSMALLALCVPFHYLPLYQR